MKDFQDVLRHMIEMDGVDPTAGDPTAAAPAKPGVSLDAATNPADAFLAYKRELEGLWGNMKGILGHADQALANLETEINDYLSDAMPVGKVDAAVDAAYKTQRARPTIDRSAIQAMTSKARTAANPTPAPGAAPGTV
jgi:hypothetical protein